MYLDAGNPTSYPGSGTTWIDVSGGNINGTLQGSPTFSSDKLGCIVLNGTNQYADLGSVSALQFNNTQAFSVSVWFNWSSSVATSQRFLLGYALAGGRGYYMAVDDTGTINTNGAFFDYYDGTSFKGIQTPNSSIVKGVWNNMTCTCDTSNTAAGMKIYVNGVAVSTTARSGASTPGSINYSAVTAHVGSRGGGSTFGGSISQVSIYNRALSAGEISSNFTALRGRYGV